MVDSLRDQLLKSGLVSKLKIGRQPVPDFTRSAETRTINKGHAGNTLARHNPPNNHASSRQPTSRNPANTAGAPAQSSRRSGAGNAPRGTATASRGATGQDEIDLAKAYALRNMAESAERARLQKEAEQRAREKKERRQKMTNLLAGKSLNSADADVARHFPHADKIRRIYVTAAQLPRLNSGELAVVQWAGRFVLVDRAVGLVAQAIDPAVLVLLADADAQPDDGVPDDLVW